MRTTPTQTGRKSINFCFCLLEVSFENRGPLLSIGGGLPGVCDHGQLLLHQRGQLGQLGLANIQLPDLGFAIAVHILQIS